ncbi:MAG TPA: hypothetical protein VKF81_15825, partial [Blastocatellia bacterium]|nr:hypothetical protein [Blastocatellia bacterium]
MHTTDVSPQNILESLPKSRERGIDADRLAEALNLSESQAARLASILKEFVRVGLATAKAGRYWRKHSVGLLIGTVRGTRSGHVFVVPDDPKERDKGDLFVNARAIGSALHGDKVIARLTRVSERGREGRVEA